MEAALIAAIIRAPHGVRGEFKISSTSGESRHLAKLETAVLRFRGLQKQIRIEGLRGKIPNLIMKIEGVDSPEAVKEIQGAQILIQRSEALPLADNEYYAADLEGLSLVYKGKELGSVKSVWDGPGGSNLELLLADGQTRHLPFHSEFIGEVDLAGRRLELLLDWVLE